MSNIYLKNPGLLDLDFLKLMGCNVKESDNSIGMFGTGMKYAIAVFLREGIEFSMYLGHDKYEFYTESKILRGKQFQVCALKGPIDSIELGFTTELGRNWEPWMAYREIHSNCLDENGIISKYDNIASQSGHTLFIVEDRGFDGVFISSTDKELINKGSFLSVYKGESECLYYRGIRAKPEYSLYTYDYTQNDLSLTEDRTLSSAWGYHREIMKFILNTQDKSYIEALLTNDGYLEHRLDISSSGFCIDPKGALALLIDDYEKDDLPLNFRRYKLEVDDEVEEPEEKTDHEDTVYEIMNLLYNKYDIDLDEVYGRDGISLRDSILEHLEGTDE